MEEATIEVAGEVDRLVVAGLEELRPLLEEIGDGLLLVGGQMTRVWLHLRPVDVPVRTTADVDFGVDRRALRLSARRSVVGPQLRALGFEQRLGEEQFRFVKVIEGRAFPVDLGIAPGGSRARPPLLEKGMTAIEMPGLAYALRHRTAAAVKFVDGERTSRFELPLPRLDAAFVLKGALVASGARLRPQHRQRDTADALSLALACAGDDAAVDALRANRRRSDVAAAIRWLARGFDSPRSAAARRTQVHFEEEAGISSGAEWAVESAARLIEAVS